MLGLVTGLGCVRNEQVARIKHLQLTGTSGQAPDPLWVLRMDRRIRFQHEFVMVFDVFVLSDRRNLLQFSWDSLKSMFNASQSVRNGQVFTGFVDLTTIKPT